MTFSHYARIKNNQIVKTKYGKEVRVINVLLDGQEQPIWINKLDQFSDLKPGQTINVIRGAKGSLTILENTPSMNEVTNGNGRHSNTLPTQTYSQPNRNGLNTPSSSEEDILDLPMLSDADKRNIMSYIKSQSKLLKFCYDVICQDFPTLEEYDPRGARSLAISLLISANQARDKYMK